MALIICPECGKQISDKAECCIGCGFPLKYLAQQEVQRPEEVQEDIRTDLEKLVDEIYSKNSDMFAAMNELMLVTGMDLRNADDIMRKKYTGRTKKEEKAARKEEQKRALRQLRGVLSSDPLKFANVARCPKCQSVSLHYKESDKGDKYAVCMKCGNEWKL